MRPPYRIAFAVALAAGCLPAVAAEPDAPADLISRSDAIRITVQDRLSANFTAKSEARKAERGALVEYYTAPDARLLWVDENGITTRGKAVMDEIAKADDYGLRASDYKLPDTSGADGGAGADALANAEIKISHAVLQYARDARGGRIEPQKLSRNLDPTLALPDPFEVIATIGFRSEPDAYLRSFQPDQPQFEALRKKLIELRGGSVVQPEQPKVVKIPEGPTLRKGMEHEQVALLRARLEVPADSGNDNLYDDGVEQAVREFQSSRGARADGMVGPGTRRLLNGQQARASNPASERSILVNMERWRWLPHDLGSFYVRVNVPEFTLRVGKDDEIIHTARVVVGKPDKQTPIFSEDMQTVVFGPFWNVPTSIKVEEIRPYLRQSGGWLFGGGGGWNTSVFQRHNLRIRYGGREVDPGTVDWNRMDIRNFEVYQPPGPSNVLGKVKFLFPNKHDVYMHDTPQKHLFANRVRAESHGCMRVQNPDQLAAIVMKHDQGWSRGQTASAMDNSYDQQVPLRQKIPVYVTYFTVSVDENGSISTFNDLYGHDARMASALGLRGSYDRAQWEAEEETSAPQRRANARNPREWETPWSR